MPQPTSPISRRRFVGVSAFGVGGFATSLWPEAQLFAEQAHDYVMGPPLRDIEPRQISPHVWIIFAPDGFPTPENRGMMSNVTFVVTSAGVVILDSGSSLQIGQMAIRMIRKVTDKPVVAVFNSHFHGDHWLGNHAFVEAFGKDLPIYALPRPKTNCIVRRQVMGKLDGKMDQPIHHRDPGHPPNQTVSPGQVFRFGDVSLKMHFYGRAHTESDLCVQVVEDKVTAVGDIAMANRIANIDDGSYPGTFKYYAALSAACGEQLWAPGHGEPGKNILQTYGAFLSGIWDSCLQAVKDNKSEAQAKAMVMKEPRVAARAMTMQGFDGNIGKYTSLAYLEAEKEAF